MANFYDLIRAATLVIGLGCSAQQGRKAWIWSDSVLWGTYGLALFVFPGSLVKFSAGFRLRFLDSRLSNFRPLYQSVS